MAYRIGYTCWHCGASDEDTTLVVRLDVEYGYSSATCLEPAPCDARLDAQLREMYESDGADEADARLACARCGRTFTGSLYDICPICPACDAECMELDLRDREAVTA